MSGHQYVEPTKHEKNHIVSLVNSAGIRSKGILIKDIPSLHDWAGVPNGFDARFLAKLFQCKLMLPDYSDPELSAKLDGWLAWYKKRANENQPSSEPATSVVVISFKSSEETKPRVHQQNWDHKCEACGGHGTQHSSEHVCEYCGGSGWMSHMQYKNFINDAASLQRQADTPAHLLHHLQTNDDWKKSQVICSVCDGDGGAAGQCYKCGGSGWVFAK